jgi:energy-coupling factor transporter ATP-binding protein EcfA2
MSPSPPSQPQWPAIIALIVAIGGVPTAAAFAFADQITKNPWRAAAVAVVYLLGLFVLSVITGIWQRLQAPWLDQAARWVDTTLRRRLSGYDRRYRRFMVEQHRSFDVKGLTTQGPYSLMLDEVFVDLSLAPQPAHLVRSNPIPAVPEALAQGQHSIWAYLQSKQMRTQHLAVLGAPGSGKTTLLRHIALVLASGKRSTSISTPRRMPILLFLRDHAAVITANPQLTLAAAIRDHLARLEGPLPPPDWFERQLAAGSCLVMLDGLDEVADLEQRKQVVQWVDRQTTVHANNRFIVTSRPFGFRSTPLERMTVVEVHAFTHAQVERFVANWYLANEIMSAQRDDAGVRRDARRGAEDLLVRLRNTQNLADLAINPLLLTMIANVHRYSSSLPERRVELYREISTVFLGKRQAARGIVQDLTPAQKQRVLQALAYALMTRQVREIALDDAVPLIRDTLERITLGLTGEQFLQQIEEGSGLLIEREHQMYSFAHLTFQEYLAATHILEQRLEQELVGRTSESWWHETIRLYAAQADATGIVDACIGGTVPSIEALSLAIDCSQEARELRPDVRTRLEAMLTQGVEDADPERRRLIAEALLARRLRRMVRLDDQRAIDTSLLSHAEYQLFLDGRYAQGACHQPDHWQGTQFPTGQGRAPVLGMRHSDAIAFCSWLTDRSGGIWSYRLPYPEELPRADGNVQFATRSDGLVCWAGTEAGTYIDLSLVSPAQTQVWIEQRVLQDYMDFMVHVFTPFASDAHHLTNELTRAHARGLPLVRDLTIVLDRACEHTRARALAVGRSSDLVRNRARDLANDLARARDLANDLARSLASARTGARARDLANNLARSLASALDVDRTLMQISIAANGGSSRSYRVVALNLDQYCAGNLNLNLEHDVALIHDHARPTNTDPGRSDFLRPIAQLTLAQALAIVCQRDSSNESDQPVDRVAARQAVRYIALFMIDQIQANRDNQSRVWQVFARSDNRQAEMQRLLNAYVDLYVSLAILEERIAGTLLPCEGLLLLRELTEQSGASRSPKS